MRSGPRFLLWLLRCQWRGQLRALAWGTVHLSAVASFPFAIGLAVQAVVDRDGARLALAGGLMVLLGAASAVADTMLHRAAVINWLSAASRVQQLLARQTAALGSVLTRRVAAGEVVSVSTGDVEKIGWFVEGLSRFGAAVLSSVAVCTGLVLYQPEMGSLVALAVPLVALAPLPLLPAAARRADAQREQAGRATELAADTVAGLRVLRGIGGEELFLDRYRRASQRVRQAAVRSARMWALISAIQVALPGLLLLTVVWFGARAAMEGRISPGELVTVYGAVLFLLYPLRHVEEIAMAYSFSRPSAVRAARVLGLRRGPAGAGASAASDEQPTGDLFDPVSGLLAPAGQLTAVVCGDPDEAGLLAERLGGHPSQDHDRHDAHKAGRGEPPAPGKSPDPSPGRGVERDPPGRPSVRLGGVALDELPLDTARGAVLVQDKDPVLLSGTLRELLDVPSSGAVSVPAALAAAQCADVLTALAQAAVDVGGDPLLAPITERGRSLSGGQRQRLALARSLVTDPEVLVLDEPTSAVDSHTEARVADGLCRLRADRTTVVLTSSPLVLDRADRVVLVADGSVAAVGTHRELLRGSTRYRAIVTRETDEERAGSAPHLEEFA